MNYYDIVISVSLLIFSAWIWRYKLRPGAAKSSLVQWLDKQPDAQNIRNNINFLTKLYKNTNPGRISHADRNRIQANEDQYIYGEIDFLSFIRILKMVNPQPGEIFYDLGCGAGKAVFTAALSFDFDACVGIEYLPGLCRLADRLLHNSTQLAEKTDTDRDSCLHKLSAIHFFNDDMLNYDFSDGDIIFINATCFHHYMWEKLTNKLLSLKNGARIIVTSKKINNNQFELIYSDNELMSWGVNSVNIYQKNS